MNDQPVELGNDTQLPTSEQLGLRKRYTRIMGWCGTLGVLFLVLAIYNVARGLDAFGSVPMFVGLAFAVGFGLPAIRANSRRKKLDAFVAAGSTEMPKHMKSWQVWLTTAVVVLLAVVWVSLPQIVESVNQPSAEEERAQYIIDYRKNTFESLSGWSDIGPVCIGMSDPQRRIAMTEQLQLIVEEGPESPFLTSAEQAQIGMDVLDEICKTG
jgi:hypothetical protein